MNSPAFLLCLRNLTAPGPAEAGRQRLMLGGGVCRSVWHPHCGCMAGTHVQLWGGVGYVGRGWFPVWVVLAILLLVKRVFSSSQAWSRPCATFTAVGLQNVLSPQREPRQLTAVTLAPHPGPPQPPVSSLSLHVCLFGNVHISAVVPREASGSGFSL